jgi:hypothetical protein
VLPQKRARLDDPGAVPVEETHLSVHCVAANGVFARENQLDLGHEAENREAEATFRQLSASPSPRQAVPGMPQACPS